MKGDGRKALANGRDFPALHIPVGKTANRNMWGGKI
jgi:hypothetical protein